MASLPYFELIKCGKPSSTLLVVTPGGRAGVAESRAFAKSLVTFAIDVHALTPVLPSNSAVLFDVLIWDRRNTGNSEVNFSTGSVLSLEEAKDLEQLLSISAFDAYIYLFLFGCSSGCRLSAIFAHQSTDSKHGVLNRQRKKQLRGMVFAPPTGGRFAADLLAKEYYLNDMTLVQKAQSMDVLFANSRHYKRYCSNNPRAQEQLKSTLVLDFLSTMKSSAEFFYNHRDSALLGVDDTFLQSLAIPVLLIQDNNETDRIHTIQAADAVANLLPNCTRVSVKSWNSTGSPECIPTLTFLICSFLNRHSAQHLASSM
jgi:pimeloyl-ACP methyl ester carboxylesterase